MTPLCVLCFPSLGVGMFSSDVVKMLVDEKVYCMLVWEECLNMLFLQKK